MAQNARKLRAFSQFSSIRRDRAVGTQHAFFSGVNLPLTSATSTATPTTPRTSVRPSTLPPAHAFGGVLRDKSSAAPASSQASGSTGSSSHQDTPRGERRHPQSGTLQSPHPLPTNIAPIVAPSALATSALLSPALSPGTEDPSPVNASTRSSVDSLIAAQDPHASEQITAAAFTGSAGLVKGVAVDGVISPDNLPSTEPLNLYLFQQTPRGSRYRAHFY